VAFDDQADLRGIFTITDFAVEGVYTPAGGTPKVINGIFDKPQASRNATEYLEITIPAPQFVCPSADVIDVEEGDTLRVDSVTYTIRVVLNDGTGVTTLILEKN